MENLRKIWNDTCLAAGIPALSTDLAAQIMVCLYLYGNNEEYTLSPNFLADVEYIQKRFNLLGGEAPDVEFVEIFQEYVKELEQLDDIPLWASKMFKDRYGITLRH